MAALEQLQQLVQGQGSRIDASEHRERQNTQVMSDQIQRLETLVAEAKRELEQSIEGNWGTGGKDKNLSEHRAVTGIPPFAAGERGPYKEWQTKVLNALTQVRKGIRGILERAGRQMTERTKTDYDEATAHGRHPLAGKGGSTR